MRNKAWRRAQKINRVRKVIRDRKLKEVSCPSHWYEGHIQTKKMCSCWMCRSARKYLKGNDRLTWQEIKQDVKDFQRSKEIQETGILG